MSEFTATTILMIISNMFLVMLCRLQLWIQQMVNFIDVLLHRPPILTLFQAKVKMGKMLPEHPLCIQLHTGSPHPGVYPALHDICPFMHFISAHHLGPSDVFKSFDVRIKSSGTWLSFLVVFCNFKEL